MKTEKTKTFYKKILSRTANHLEFRVFDNNSKPVARLWSNSYKEIKSFIKEHKNQHHIYFGCATRSSKGGKKEDCREVIFLWVDIDFKDFQDGEEEARKRLKSFPHQPTVIINSGGGLHCYWFLKKNLDAQSDRTKVEEALKFLANELGADQSRTEIASMLRASGSINMKEERNGAKCKVEKINFANTISLKEIIKTTKPHKGKTPALKQTKNLKKLAKEIVQGNRDGGAFRYISTYIQKHGAKTDDNELTLEVQSYLDKAGGNGVDAIKNKVPMWIEKAHKLFDRQRKLTPLEIADTIINGVGGNIVYYNQNFKIYSDGFWGICEEELIRKMIAELDKPYTSGPRTNNALQVLKDITAKKGEEPKRNLICLINGTFDLDESELLPHSPDHWLFNQMPVKWDEDAKCTLWRQTLKEIFEGDSDAKQKINFLKRWFGYCLVPDTSQSKFLWMTGSGANGKSLVLTILTEIVGKENVSHALLTRLENAFVRSSLQDKLLNISSEMKAEDTVNDGYLKAIVSGDMIEAEQKYKDSFSFSPYTRIVAATNELPRLLDHSDGFKRRAVILAFNRTFQEKDQDKQRTDKLLRELSGILVWAVKGLRRLREKGAFKIPPSSMKELGQYMKDSNSTEQFADEALMESVSGTLTGTDIYNEFASWAHDRGYTKMNISTFGKRLKALNFRKRRTNGKEFWCLEFKSTFSAQNFEDDGVELN